ncbi:MAG: caspase family protein [Clostridia bacterium]|nr:caspase family protein [Clostridia bacterium]
MDRLALVIGNSDYKYVNVLKNPKNDANDMAMVLEKLKFKVIKCLDVTQDELDCAFNAFLRELDDYTTGLFYYAGHGMQIDGENYIVPTDCELSDKQKTIISCYNLNTYLKRLSAYKGKVNICILDACRDNPFTAVRGSSGGFTEFRDTPKGTIIAYSTSPDCSASDGIGSNGLYTQVLKDAIQIPNIKIEDMFKTVRVKVSELSGETQVSWEHSSLVGDFYFSVVPMPVNVEYSDEEIYTFITERAKYYEQKTEDIYDIECLPYVDAYIKYSIPIVKLLRAYSRINYAQRGDHFSDATIDEINYSYLTLWGFSRSNGRWYYKGTYVEMGDLLPLPTELSPMPPLINQELKIGGRIKYNIDNGKIRMSLFSNIPEGTPLIFSLKGKKYAAQCSTEAVNPMTPSELFSNRGRPLANGHYKVTVTCPSHSVLPETIKAIFGERNRNLTGNSVKFDPISGNTIHMTFDFLLNDGEVHTF